MCKGPSRTFRQKFCIFCGKYRPGPMGPGGGVYCRGNSWPMYSTGKAVPPEAT
mgnify:CR=1 FL=1